MSFISLTTGTLYKKPEKKKKLKNFPAGYVGSFYRNLADNVSNSFWVLSSAGELIMIMTFLMKMFKNISLQQQ